MASLPPSPSSKVTRAVSVTAAGGETRTNLASASTVVASSLLPASLTVPTRSTLPGTSTTTTAASAVSNPTTAASDSYSSSTVSDSSGTESDSNDSSESDSVASVASAAAVTATPAPQVRDGPSVQEHRRGKRPLDSAADLAQNEQQTQPSAKKSKKKKRQPNVNREIVMLNNDSVIYLQMGDPEEAFKLLTEASSLLNGLFEKQRHTKAVSHQSYKYNWIDFSETMVNHLPSTDSAKYRGNDSSVPYLFLRALKISKTCKHENFDSMCYCGDTDQDVCPCGIAWVVWYNLAISCTLLGCRLGEKGYRYLDRAYHLYEIVRGRILSQVPSKDWSTLLMAVFNNQSCIYHEYGMYDESSACLKKVRDILAKMPAYRNSPDWQVFTLNLILLRRPTLASAA